ncbi:Uncharacterised protein [Vibrio cholerae]|nr:Uncharacterised protein [Vibrio cholerae]
MILVNPSHPESIGGCGQSEHFHARIEFQQMRDHFLITAVFVIGDAVALINHQ